MTNSQRLKEETLNRHNRIEILFRAKSVFDGTFTVEAYLRLLEASHRYIESIVVQTGMIYPVYATLLKRKLEAIKEDLVILDRYPVIFAVKDQVSLSPLQMMGHLYVIIGSMLGNHVIYRRLQLYEDFRNLPFHYMTLHQEDISEVWKEFVSLLDRIEYNKFPEVVRGAISGL